MIKCKPQEAESGQVQQHKWDCIAEIATSLPGTQAYWPICVGGGGGEQGRFYTFFYNWM